MFGIYVHIPYCIQRCHYCDFATYTRDKIPPADQYVDLLINELDSRRVHIENQTLNTLYFGGGTPSLIDPGLIRKIVDRVRSHFTFAPDIEVTIEINPGTLNRNNLDAYQEMGFNRFSVGAQTFNEKLLKACGREHSVAQTRELLGLLRERKLNYTFDLLFGLPGQTLEDLERDVYEVLEFSPPHLSAYCLTVPTGHPMSTGRAPDEEQVKMFALIEEKLKSAGILKYEISNFARPGYESRHNLLYWTDMSYWGLGLSAHSYLRNEGHGLRFWNPKTYDGYANSLTQTNPKQFDEKQSEHLKTWESLTDFCHISLRLSRGLSLNALQDKFGKPIAELVSRRINALLARKMLVEDDGLFRLSTEGEMLSNKVFLELAFSEPELKMSET